MRAPTLRSYKGSVYPGNRPKTINLRTGLEEGKDIQFGVRAAGDATKYAELHEVYEKTAGREAWFRGHPLTMHNQDGQLVAIIDNRFMHR